MSWEHLPDHPGARRWLLAVLVVGALVAVAMVAIAAMDATDAQPTDDTLAIDAQAPADGATEPTKAAVDPAAFTPDPLVPMERSTESPGDGPPLPGAGQPFTLLATDHLGLWAVDLNDGRTRRDRLEGPAVGSMFPGPLLTEGPYLVFNTAANVVRVTNGQRRPQIIGRAYRAIPTLDNGTVWMVDDRAGFAAGGTAVHVTLDGQILDEVALPAAAVAFYGTADGLLVSARGVIARVGVDGSRSLIARGDPVTSDGQRLAWVRCAGDLTCDLVLGTLDDPEGVRLRLPADELPLGGFGVDGGAFSPDGRWLAMVTFQAAPGDDQATDRPIISFVDVLSGVEVHRARGASDDPFSTTFAWAPDSEWLIFSSADGISSWRAGSRQTTALDLGFSTARGLAIVPSSD